MRTKTLKFAVKRFYMSYNTLLHQRELRKGISNKQSLEILAVPNIASGFHEWPSK